MREIKAHRTGSPLNESLRLECDEESGKYHVLVKAHGQWGPKLKLEFQSKDFSEDTGGPAGISDEVLLAMVLDRLEQAKDKNWQTSLAITKLEELMFWLSRRPGQVQIIKKEEGK